MAKGDIYRTKRGQTRHELGTTPTGDVGFATKGKHPFPDYSTCQIQTQQKFKSQGTFVRQEPPTEIARVQSKFANYIAAKGIK